jgi:hypothetical protein
MLNGFHVVIDRFVQPQVQFGNPAPDIAIREINPDHFAHIGKEAMDLDSMKEALADIRHAYAVGFPEKLKYQKYDNDRFHGFGETGSPAGKCTLSRASQEPVKPPSP